MVRWTVLNLIVVCLFSGCGIEVEKASVRSSEHDLMSGPTAVPNVGTTEELTPRALAEPAPGIRVSIYTYDGPSSSLRQRIAGAEVIAKVDLQSVKQVIEAVPSPYTGNTAYVAALEYSFRVLEYLEGSGATEIVGIAYDITYFHDTREQAEASTEDFVSTRDTRWDDREAVVFLHKRWFTGQPESTRQAGRYVFGAIRHLYPEVDGSDLDSYTVGSRVNKAWLPAASANGGSAYLMDDPASAGPGGAPTITLTALKAEISAVEAEVAVGDGTEAYRECIYEKYRWEEREQYYYNKYGHLWTPRRIEVESGQAPSATVQYETGINSGPNVQYWLEGEDAALFTIPSIGRIQAVRPLPAGEYMYMYLDRRPVMNICDAFPEEAKKRDRRIMVAVAPDGVLHELFFDPVTLRQAQGERSPVGADGSNGVLKPASFTDANGASATIESISYEPPTGSDQTGTVKLEVDPHTGLASHVVDFIELDGSVSLSLRVAGATVDSANDTLSWSVSSQPWEDGDKLMVRIYEAVPAPEGLSVSLADDTFTVTWSAVTGADQYRAGYRTGGSEAEWTNLDATTGTSQTFSPEGGVACGTTYEFRVQARGDGTTYLATWGDTSEPVSLTNTVGACNNPPVFTSDTFTFTVPEDAPAWPAVHVVGVVSAPDPDEGDSIGYHITAGNEAGRFIMSSSHSGGQILVRGALDYETAPSYTLTVEARDGKVGGTASATVEISVTNVDEGGPPAPEDLSVSLSEGTFSISWSAVTGADRYLAMYRVGAGNWTNLGATTGTSQTFSPAGEVGCGTTYEFRVQARGDGEIHIADWGATSEPVSHTTGACNSPPAFGSATYSFSVSEDAAIDAAVGTVSAPDPDEGDSVTYSITAGNDEGKFSIDSSGGSITVAASLDYETVSSYTLTVTASDGKEGGTTTATVGISVTNVAEGVPSAPEDLAVSLSEDTFSISWSAVTGADQYRVQYRAGGAEGNWTNLDATTSTSQTFSPEGGPACGTTYDFRVQARGDGETHTANWGAASESVSHTTGACNRPPAFGSATYSFSVSEDASTGAAVGTVSAPDPDEGDSATYSITAGNDAGKFSIDSSGGGITVAASLDYETASSYMLTVTASDGKEEGTSSATVEISVTNVAEGVPSAPEDLAVSLSGGTFSISWSAVTGADQYRVQYRTGGAEGTWTNLDATTSTSQTLSPEGGPACGTTYEFRVQAQGDGETHIADWGATSAPVSHTTGACNRPPAFGSATYSFSVSEDAATGAAVGTVSAPDPDEGDSVTYSITAGNDGGKFSIDSSGGSITVAASLDYETVSSYTLTVEASDGKEGGTTTATVGISVTNVAEGVPSAPEDLAVSLSDDTFSISWSAVTGADQYRVGYRTGGAEGTWTNLDATTSTSQTFSPEGGPACGTTYDFRVQARGDGETHIADWGATSAPVSHTTGACNRPPAFGSATYSFSVSEDAATGAAVGTVSAPDPDEGDSVTYSITAGNGDAKFSIGGSDGSITVAGSLDYETTLSYTLTVQAIDGDSSTATATVKISVTDVSEAAPPPPTNMTSSYNSAAGSFGFTWHAVAGADVYRVQYRVGGAEGNWTNLEATTSTSHTFRPVGGPLCGTTYKFQIQARGDGETYPANWSSGSGSVTYNTPACNVAESPPPAPQNLAATATHSSVTLSWTAPDDSTVAGYQILRRRPDHGETELLVHVSDTGSTATTYTDSALQASTRYVYRVKAINAAGVGPFSNRVTATTASRP